MSDVPNASDALAAVESMLASRQATIQGVRLIEKSIQVWLSENDCDPMWHHAASTAEAAAMLLESARSPRNGTNDEYPRQMNEADVRAVEHLLQNILFDLEMHPVQHTGTFEWSQR